MVIGNEVSNMEMAISQILTASNIAVNLAMESLFAGLINMVSAL